MKNNSKAVWIVPSRALARQTSKNFNSLNNESLSPLCLVGAEEIKEEELHKSKLWICTTEKFEALLRKRSINKITEKIETIVIDEIHNLSDQNRGQTLESLIARYRDRSPQKRIIGLSATLQNDEEFAAWCNARLVKSDYRQSKIYKEVIKYESNDLSWKEEEIVKTNTLINLIKKILSDSEKKGSILTFCFSRPSCIESAFALANFLSSKILEFDKTKLDISEETFQHLKKLQIGINFSGFNYSKLFLNFLKEEKSSICLQLLDYQQVSIVLPKM